MNNGNIYLTGFMACGKSTIGQKLALKLNMPFLDLDEFVSVSSGYTPAQLIDEYGEPHFRKWEKEALKKAAALCNCVIALGGGTVLDGSALELVKKTGTVVWLDAKPETVLSRIELDKRDRPIFAVDTYTELMEKRREWYSKADIRIKADTNKIEDIVDEIAQNFQKKNADNSKMKKITVKTATPYDVVFANELAGSLKTVFNKLFIDEEMLKKTKKAVVVTSPILKCLYGPIIENELSVFDIKFVWLVVNDGEQAKSLKIVEDMYEISAKLGFGSDSMVISLGGGSIGDAAGFFASTYCRGIPLVHVPTTLLAMADSSVGGKTALNLREGKNLVGTFWQPIAVAIGSDTLKSLPKDEISSGMAELVKAAVVGDEELFEIMEENVETTSDVLNLPNLTEMIFRSVKVKVDLVEKDERDSSCRKLLNLGHTTAHALEAASGYRGLTHGQAVSIGIAAAVKIAVDSGKLAKKDGDRIRSLLKKLGLPIVFSRKGKTADIGDELISAISLDKKNVDGRLNMVVPEAIGKCVITSEYDSETLVRVINSLEESI